MTDSLVNKADKLALGTYLPTHLCLAMEENVQRPQTTYVLRRSRAERREKTRAACRLDWILEETYPRCGAKFNERETSLVGKSAWHSTPGFN